MIRSDELVVDSFAGGGGASTGIEMALGRDVDIAINHNAAALAVHRANHPRTTHYCEDVFRVDPVAACAGRPVGLAWFSPDCTHFSRAKGAKPVSRRVRGLAWVAARWAKAVRPRVIVLENVEEFVTWGPLDDAGRPRAKDTGRTFRAFVAKLRSYGYEVEWRALVAADFGVPTTRKRLFLIARCDGQPIAWPAPTHGKGRGQSWRSAASIIDWSLPCPSIFGRKKPLADATLRRIAAGVRRYVIESARPFVVAYHAAEGFRGQPLEQPLRTVDTANRFGLVTPFIAPVTHPRDARVHSVEEPLRTVTAANRGELAVIAPALVQTGYGEREGQAPRTLDLARPLGTVVAGGQKHGLVAAFLAKHYGGVVGHQATLPLGTITAKDHHALATARLEPSRQDHRNQVRAFLIKYYGANGRDASQQSLFEPLHTITSRPHFGLVMVDGEPYAIADIGMRMLQPHELFRAQGFSSSYVIAPVHNGRPLTKTEQIERAGNSVCPPLAAAIVAANFGRSGMERAA